MFKKFSELSLCILTFMLSGCFHSPAPFFPQNTASTATAETVTECQNDEPCLQILIMYGKHFCAHAALRLQHPLKKTLFWDPAGGYGHDGIASAERNNDIILVSAPNLNEYIFFRTEIPTAAAEIFEWQIPEHKANDLYATLVNGIDHSHPDGKFSTQGMGFFCGSHVSEFLESFANDIITVEKVFYPHNLAKQLYTQDPDRVIIVDFEKSISIKVIQ